MSAMSLYPAAIKSTKSNVENMPKGNRELFGLDDNCFVMDAKNIGNIGRYFNVTDKS